MLVYAYWTKSGHYTIQAYNSPRAAAEDVLAFVSDYIRADMKPKKKARNGAAINFNEIANPFLGLGDAPPVDNHDQEQNDNPRSTKPAIKCEPSEELLLLQDHLDRTKDNPSVDNATKAISLYEDYQKYVKGYPSVLHSLTDVPVVEEYAHAPVPQPVLRVNRAAAPAQVFFNNQIDAFAQAPGQPPVDPNMVIAERPVNPGIAIAIDE